MQQQRGAAWMLAWALLLGAAAAALAPSQRLSALWLLLLWAPWAEELVFRAGLQEVLLRRGVAAPWANAWTTLAFTLLHGLSRSWLLAAGTLLPSLLLGALYNRTRRIAPVVLLHASLNLGWILLAPLVPALPLFSTSP